MSNPLVDEIHQKLPGVTLALPTGGRYYNSDVFAPGTDLNEFEVGVLSMVDEIRYRDPYLLASGEAMKQLVVNLCPQVLKVSALCDVDIEAILLAARIGSYGSTLDMTFKCQNPELSDKEDKESRVCTYSEIRKVDLEQVVIQYAVMDDLDTFCFVLEPFKQEVCLKPMSHDMSVRMTRKIIERQRDIRAMESEEDENNPFDPKMIGHYVRVLNTSMDLTYDLLADSIFWVKTSKGAMVQDKEQIQQWIRKLSPDRINEINAEIEKLSNRIQKMSQIEFGCPECEYVSQVPIVLDADRLFLSEPESLKTPRNSSDTSKKKEKRQRTPLKNLQR